MSIPATSASRGPLSELVNIGEHYCLFRRDNSALALINESAANIVLSLIDDLDTAGFKPRSGPGMAAANAQAATVDIDLMRSQLHREGFLVEGDGEGRKAACPASLNFPGAHTGRALSLRLDGGPTVRVECEDDDLCDLLQATLWPLQAPPRQRHEIEIVVTCEADAYGVWRDGIAIATNLERVSVRRICLQALLMALLPPLDVAALLHASSVSIAERAILLAGATGSGKTTLMIALIGTGATYLADDLTALDPSGRRVAPFPVAASVKKGSWGILQRQFPSLDRCRVFKVGERMVRYVYPAPALDAVSRPTTIGALVFPTYDPALADVSVERIRPEQALSGLLETGSEVVGAWRSIKPLTTLVNETPAWCVTFPDLASGVTAVRRLAGAR